MSTGPKMSDPVTLEQPIKRGDQLIEKLQVRKPSSGELRGLSLVDLGQLEVTALRKVLPRLCIPTVTEADIDAMDPADLLELGAELGHFLLKTEKPAGSPAP